MAAQLRRQFDRSFSEPYRPPPAPFVDLLAIRLAGRRHALRQDQVSGLVARRPVVAIPSANRHLLGLAGIRGALVPVFSLATLAGVEESGEQPQWLVLCGREEPLALAFQDLEGYVRIPLTDLVGAEATGVVAVIDGEARVLLDVPTIVGRVRRGRGAEATNER